MLRGVLYSKYFKICGNLSKKFKTYLNLKK